MLDLSTNEPNQPKPGDPIWWVRRLSRRLDVRLAYVAPAGRPLQTSITRWEDYYKGKLNLALASEKWRAEFATRFPAYSSNFMELVVDKHRERLQVQGIRYGDETETDADAWAWWQANHMDAESLKLHRGALVKGSAYALVWPNEDREPEISIESANEVVVETAPGKAWKRLAALKRFVDEDGYARAELYLPDGIYKFRSSQKDIEFSMTRWLAMAHWQPYQPAGETWPIVNPIGVVPMVPYIRKPDDFNDGASKIEPVASNQDAINKLRVDAFVAAEFASFRQRWAIGVDIPIDPITKQPIEPFKSAVDRLWVVEPPQGEDPDNRRQIQFGEFEATDLEPYYKAIQGEIQMMGAIARIPYHHLLPQSGQPPSGDSLRAAEAGLVAEVLDDMVVFGDTHEELFRLNFLMRGDPRGKLAGAETIWRDPEVQSEGEHIDALLKMRAMGIPDVALWERIQGVTSQTIKRWRRLAQEQALRMALLPTPPAAPVDGQAPPATPPRIGPPAPAASGQAGA